MPTYEYACCDCDHAFELYQSFSEDPITECPECDGGKVRKVISGGAGVMFKGSGFYETDYKRAGEKKPESKSGETKAKPESKGKSDSKTTKAKPE